MNLWYVIPWQDTVWYRQSIQVPKLGTVCYGTVWYSMLWYGMVQPEYLAPAGGVIPVERVCGMGGPARGVVWCGVVWYGMVWCGVVRCGMVRYGTVWYVTVCYGMLWLAKGAGHRQYHQRRLCCGKALKMWDGTVLYGIVLYCMVLYCIVR